MKQYWNKDFLRNNKQLVIKAAAILGAIAVAFFVFVLDGDDSGEEPPSAQVEEQAFLDDSGETSAAEAREANAGEDEGTDSIVVDISGAVENPQVVELKGNSRVEDAISAAGGLKGNADITGINRAAFLADGEKIYIPTKGESASSVPTISGNSQSQLAGLESGSSGSFFAGSSSGLSGTQKVNINQATSEELQTLNGVGPATAEKIMDYRSSNGYFKTIEDIKNIDGIGDKTFEKLKEHITV